MKIWKKLVISFVISFLFAILILTYLSSRINSILVHYLNTEVERVTSNIVNGSINDLVSNQLNDDLITIYRNNNNEVEMIDYNSQKVNLLLKKINQTVYSKLLDLEEGKVNSFLLSSSLLGNRFKNVDGGIVCEIPFGTLSGNGFLTNLGPVIPIKISFLGQVNSSLKTKIRSYGINNLFLELYVHVEIKEQISLPKSSDIITLKIDAPISIKIISGVVPDYYGGVIDKNSKTTFFFND